MVTQPRQLRSSRLRHASLWGALAALSVWTALEPTAGADRQSPAEDQPAEKVYKNIQVFQGLPSKQFMGNMFYMAGSLGVSCNECHVNFEDFEKDDNPKKQTARSMIAMVRKLNQQNFNGENKINCNTCHRGQAVPLAPLAFAALKNRATTHAAPAAADAAPLPTVAQVFERYLSATGQSSTTGKPETFLLTGAMLSAEGWTAPLRIYLCAPNKFLAVFDIGWFSYNAFNGTAGWEQDNQGLHDLNPKNLALLEQQAAVFHPATLRALFSNLLVRGKERYEGREALVVEGVLTGADPEKLYFDEETGLLVRIQWGTETSLGTLPHQINLRDYREVAGRKIPFELDDFAADFSSAYRITEAKAGASIPASLFDKPAKVWKGFPQ
jgi:photosynthetic reaction center cytochrome c subunit